MLAVKQRILSISKKHNLSHLGSCFSVLPILEYLYSKYKYEVIILSCGHAGLAQYCMLEKYLGRSAEDLLEKHGVHPGFDPYNGIYCSTGSLGCGLPIAIGYALAGRPTHCIISDGECAEGSIWESLAIINERKIPVDVHVNMNGFSAYKTIDVKYLEDRLRAFLPSITIWPTSNYPFPCNVSAHYINVQEEHEKNICQNIN